MPGMSCLSRTRPSCQAVKGGHLPRRGGGAVGRDVPAIVVSYADRRRYREKVRRCLDVFARMLHESRFTQAPQQVGLEIEFNLVDEAGAPSMRSAEALGVIADPQWAPELGMFNLEINLPPRPLAGDALADLERHLTESVARADRRARQLGIRLAMIGILPSLREHDTTEKTMSPNARYQLLNEQICAARGEEVRICIEGPERLLTFVDSIMPEAACTSVQCHLQVSPETFGSYWNAAQAVAGVQVALGANSPFLFGRELWRETRITLFQQATGTRCGNLSAAAPPASASCPCTTAPSTGGTGRSTRWRTARRTCGWRTGCCRPARPSSTRSPTPPSTTAWSPCSWRPSGRSGPGCRSPPPGTTWSRPPGTASTPGCTGPAWGRSRQQS